MENIPFAIIIAVLGFAIGSRWTDKINMDLRLTDWLHVETYLFWGLGIAVLTLAVAIGAAAVGLLVAWWNR